MIDTENIWSDMASRWTTALLITLVFGGSAFICESRKQAFGMAILLGSVAFFETVHAIVKRLLFPSSGDPSNTTKDQQTGYLLAPDQGALRTRSARQPANYRDSNQEARPNMGTQTANTDSFHDAVDQVAVSTPKKAIALKKASSASKKMKSCEKRALAIKRAKQAMAEDKMKVEAVKKKRAAAMRRA